MQPLELPKKERPKGLYLYCSTCKSHYSNHRLINCKCKKLSYKAIIHIPGTIHGKVQQVLNAANLTNAISEFLNLKSYLENNNYQKIELKKVTKNPELLLECFAYYMGYLNNVDVPDHKQKTRDITHIRKVELAFNLYQEALIENDINVSILKFEDVNDNMVGFVHKYFLHDKKYSNKTYNNTMALLRMFTSHIITKNKLHYENPFLGVQHLITNKEVTAVEEDEFNNLMNIITPENGIAKRVQKGRENLRSTNWYKPWLKFGIRLGLFTGGRGDEVVLLKWSDIVLGAKDSLESIKTIDYKIDRANNHLTQNKVHLFKYFVITSELEALLLEMGYNEYKGSDKYILAPEEKMKRSTIANFLSEAFTHYYKQLNTGRDVTYKTMRKRYITSAMNQYDAASTALTNHKTLSIGLKHYHDKKETRADAKEAFSVFKKKKN